MVEKKDEAEYFNLGISLSIYIFFPRQLSLLL